MASVNLTTCTAVARANALAEGWPHRREAGMLAPAVRLVPTCARPAQGPTAMQPKTAAGHGSALAAAAREHCPVSWECRVA